MESRNLFERLVDVSPGMEIWWDSSPVIFNNWCKKILEKAGTQDREELSRQFARMYDENNPKAQLFRGVTTNPPLSLQAIQDDPVRNQQILERIPAGRWGKPDDLNGTVVFLSSEASNYVNGYTVAVDGGWLAR